MNITDNDTPRATDMAGGTHTPAACLRVRVLRVTAGSITVTDGDGRRLELCLIGATGDRTYLSHIVRAGMRLNLVRPSTEGCRADAEIVVVEPDCLIDVTAVASCFEPYGESPALFVLGRLRPRASAAAVMLGNFASQLLDEEVHGRQDEYAGSVRKFFRHNGLAMAACSDLTPDFHAEARRQRDNIAHAITHGLADTGCWRSDRAVVEPSFICEMLGLQGRMDLMQDDLKVLVEQKSGKAAWQPRPDGLKAHDKHRVQLMLYMAVLHYAFGIAYSEMHSYLLYSKYHDGLLRTDRPDGLLARAMRLRNAIAATELACAGEGAGRLLWEITPERLVTDTRGMAFMRRFAQPRIEALLRPLHEASLLERAYYLRMYRFVAAEHLLAKTGTTGCGKAGFASVWLTPAAEKIESGDMMASMTLDPVMTTVERNFFSVPEGVNPKTTGYNAGVFALTRDLPCPGSYAKLTDWLYEKMAEWADFVFLPDQAVINVAVEHFGWQVTTLSKDYNRPASSSLADLKRAFIVHSTGPRKFWCYYYFRDWYQLYAEWIAKGGEPVSIRKDSPAYISFCRKHGLQDKVFFQLMPDCFAHPTKALRFALKAWLKAEF